MDMRHDSSKPSVSRANWRRICVRNHLHEAEKNSKRMFTARLFSHAQAFVFIRPCRYRMTIDGLLYGAQQPVRKIMTKINATSIDDDDSVWIVYESPPDFPDQYVARRLHLSRPTSDYVVGNTLIEVRSKLPKGLFRIERSDRDDPLIRESWI